MSLLKAMAETHRGGRMSAEKTEALRKKRLDGLVRYAREKSPFYRSLYEGLPDTPSLDALPFVTKPQMMDRLDDVFTDRNITKKRIDEFTADTDNIGRMMDGKYLIFRTSGSTGNPAIVLYDKNCTDASSAIAAFRTFARKSDCDAFMKHGKRTAGVFADHGFYLACGMSRYLQLKMPYRQTKTTVDVNAPEEQIVRELNDFQPAMLSGYPSNLALLADIEKLDIHPDVVITGGELLTDEIREKLRNKFGCYVQTHYSCTEGGEIACECREGHLHINEDWVIIEPVDKDNNPVGYDVLSDKVLITNLANYIQPFIRYELTDRIIVHSEQCPCGKRSHWLEIEGRTDDILTFEGGVKTAPMSLYKVLEEVRSIRRFQLVQRSPARVELRIEADDREAAFRDAKRDLKAFFDSKGIKADIALSDALPQANRISGKFKHIYKDFN